MAHLSLHVFGSLQVFLAGIPVTSFESDKVRALLAYLAVESERAHRRETLIGLLWPDYPEQDARHSLRQALFNLRLALGDHTAKPPYLLITRDALQFNREGDVSLDLAQFHASYASWDRNRVPVEEADGELLDSLESMVELYQGAFLEHFSLEDSAAFEEWKLVNREAQHQRVMDALAYLTTAYERRGAYRRARRFAERQLELDPWREEAHAQLMRVLALDGQRSAALTQYEACQRVLREELGVEPSPNTRDLYEQICQGRLSPKSARMISPSAAAQPSVPPLHNLPVSISPFLGREQELAELGCLMNDSDCRLLTLLGPGGIGKTRLALQAAEQHWKKFAQGAAFIPLASVGSVEAVIPAIADAIHFEFYGPSDPKEQVLHHLRDKQMLLVLDNLEHLLKECEPPGKAEEVKQRTAQPAFSDFIIELMQQAPQVKLVATSREALDLQNEWLFEVQGLSFPEMGQAVQWEDDSMPVPYSALALFAQRARRARPDFVFSPEDKSGAASICRLVEGMPLAIELAATWMRILSPVEIAQEIENSLDFLNARMRDLPERHRSMRAVFDRSWETLSASEKQVLSRLSVFRGGFQRQAAERVAGASLHTLSALIARSLLQRSETLPGSAAGRYDLHELIRQYAGSKLAEDPGELQAARERHSLYFLSFLEEKGAGLNSQHQKEALVELTLEIDNIRVAWDWAVAHHQYAPLYQASTALWYLYELRNWFKEGEATFQKAADILLETLPGDLVDSLHQITQNALRAHCGYFRFRLGRGDEAYAILAPSVAFLRTSGELPATIYSLWYMGIVCWQMGRFSEAKASLVESLKLSRQRGDRWYEALAGEFLGILAGEEGAYQHGQRYLKEAVDIFRQIGDPMMFSHGLTDLGRTMLTLGEYDEAETLLEEGLAIARELECRFGEGAALEVLAQVTQARGNYPEAHTLFQSSAGLFREIGDTYRLSQALNHQGFNSLARSDPAGAETTFRAALKLAHEGGLIPAVLHALAGLAALKMAEESSVETLEWIRAILQHPACNTEVKVLAGQIKAELESKLSPDEVRAAGQNVQMKRLDEVIQQVLA